MSKNVKGGYFILDLGGAVVDYEDSDMENHHDELEKAYEELGEYFENVALGDKKPILFTNYCFIDTPIIKCSCIGSCDYNNVIFYLDSGMIKRKNGRWYYYGYSTNEVI